MIIGMPTLIEFDNIEENVKLCKELGLDFIEINMNLPQYQIDNLEINKLIEIKNKENIFFTFHLDEDLDIANFNEKIRTAHINTTLETIEAAKKLQTPILNMHMNLGVYFKMPDKKIFLYKKYFEEYMNRINEFRNIVDKKMRDNTNTKISIENTGIYEHGFIKLATVELLKSRNFGITYDIGHDFSSGNKDKAFIMENKDRLLHMHLHDAKGKSNHLQLFTGEIDIMSELKISREITCTYVIETKTVAGLKNSVDKLKKALKEI